MTDAPKITAVNPQDLGRKYGCLTCHSIDRKIVGPSFREVAVRYGGEVDANLRLVESVKRGGKTGNWGAVPQPPYPNVTDSELGAIISWVLSLR
jgi:cytochrome c